MDEATVRRRFDAMLGRGGIMAVTLAPVSALPAIGEWRESVGQKDTQSQEPWAQRGSWPDLRTEMVAL
jgi:hypothetical protein